MKEIFFNFCLDLRTRQVPITKFTHLLPTDRIVDMVNCVKSITNLLEKNSNLAVVPCSLVEYFFVFLLKTIPMNSNLCYELVSTVKLNLSQNARY